MKSSFGGIKCNPPDGSTSSRETAGFLEIFVSDVTLFAVSVILGLISKAPRKSNSLPVVGDVNTGISWVWIAVVLEVRTSSIG